MPVFIETEGWNFNMLRWGTLLLELCCAVCIFAILKRFFWNRLNRDGRIAMSVLSICAVFISFFVASSINIPHRRLTVTAHGKNADSLEATIYLEGIVLDGVSKKVPEPVSGQWTWYAGRYCWFEEGAERWQEGTTESVTFEIGTAHETELVFLGNQWKGIVKILIDGVESTLDTYVDKKDGIEVRAALPAPSLRSEIRAGLFSALSFAVTMLLLCTLSIIVLLRCRFLFEVGTMEMNKQKNNAFELYRFLFACIVFFLHIRKYAEFKSPNEAFNGGYLSVEFFFILSGFLMMGRIEKDRNLAGGQTSEENLAVNYLISRYRKLMPLYWSSIVVLFLVSAVVLAEFDIKSSLLKGLPELFCVQIFWRPGGVDGHLWFVSALIWAGSLVYYLVLKYKDVMLNVVFPLMLLTGIGYLFQAAGHIDLTRNDPIFLAPFLRAFIEIGFGCVLYHIYRKLPQEPVVSKGLQTLAEILLLSVCIIIMWRTRRDYKDFIMIFLLGGLILITASGKGISLLNNRVSSKLGGLSYAIFVNQNIFQRIVLSKFPGRPYWPTALITLAVTIVYSLFMNAALRHIFQKSRG